LQNGVAKSDAKGFVDRFEMVQIDNDQRALMALLAGQGEQGVESLGQQGAIRQAGQFIVVGEVFNARLGGFLAGNVLLDRQVMGDLAIGLANRADYR